MSLAYRLAASAAAPALRVLLGARTRAGKEDPSRIDERFGVPSAKRPPGPLLWIHAASNGEARSALALVARLLESKPDLTILFTSFTLTAARMLAETLPPRAIHQFVPLDVPAWVNRFLDHWRPDAALWIESDLWPTLVGETAGRGIAMAYVNARISEKSFRRWQRAAPLFRPPLQAFRVCLAQSKTDAERLRALGATDPRFVGHLKFDGAELSADPQSLHALSEAIGDRPVWLAASTHAGEEAVVIETHRLLIKTHPRLLTVLVPRHARRGDEVAALLQANGIRSTRRSMGALPAVDTEIYLADTMGELGVFYRLVGLAFVGASLVPRGGQNPLEAAQLGCALAFGPHMTNCRDIADALLAVGAACEIHDAAELARCISTWLSDATARKRAADAAADVAAQGRGATARVIEALAPVLDALTQPKRNHAAA